MKSRTRVLIADDSPFVCRLLGSYFGSAPGFEVVGTALNGRRALALVKQYRPDVVTMDMEMPELGGLEAVSRIIHECPTPIVVISGVSGKAAAITLQALGLGAVDFVLKYMPGRNTDPDVLRQEILAKVRAAANIPVIRSLESRVENGQLPARDQALAPIARFPPRTRTVEDERPLSGDVVIFGASTGGPLVLRELLARLPADYPGAIIIVQHIPRTFTGVRAAQLNRHTPLRVKEAVEGDILAPGTALVAPGGLHLLLGSGRSVVLQQGPKVGGHRPSIDVTMQSAADLYGARAKGVVLTGMGEDGKLGLAAIHSAGGVTYAQAFDSCVVAGMPQRAVENGVVDHVARPAGIAELLLEHCKENVLREG